MVKPVSTDCDQPALREWQGRMSDRTHHLSSGVTPPFSYIKVTEEEVR